MAELRWWAIRELPDESKQFAPMRLGPLALELIERGVPAEPIETGL